MVLIGFFLGWMGSSLYGPESSASRSDRKKEPGVRQALQGLGYSSGYHERESPTGVLKHDSPAWDGYNVYTSAHRAEANLMTMKGETVHSWQYSLRDAFPDRDIPARTLDAIDFRYWRKVHLYPDGDLLAIYSPYGIIKIDRDSRLLWARQDVQHHDMDVGPEGRIYSLTKTRKSFTLEDVRKRRLVDTITVYSDTGEKTAQYDLLNALRRSRYRSALGLLDKRDADLLHVNSIDVLKGGSLLLSIKKLNALARFDPNERRITWMLFGKTSSQHDAQMYEPGRITAFDNRNHLQSSRAVEIDVPDEKVVWSWDGGDDNAFFSHCCGTVQRLPDGNTLVNDTTSGRVFEVTRDGRVVWKWVNPHRTDEGKIATTFEFRRYPTDYFTFLD